MQRCTTQTQQQIDAAITALCKVGDHREVWDQLLPGLQALHAQGAQDWDIEGVRDLLDNEQAILLLDAADPSAFAVVQLDVHPYCAQEMELFVLLVWHQGGRAMARFSPVFDTLARTAGAQHIRFFSRRVGMLKAATKV